MHIPITHSQLRDTYHCTPAPTRLPPMWCWSPTAARPCKRPACLRPERPRRKTKSSRSARNASRRSRSPSMWNSRRTFRCPLSGRCYVANSANGSSRRRTPRARTSGEPNGRIGNVEEASEVVGLDADLRANFRQHRMEWLDSDRKAPALPFVRPDPLDPAIHEDHGREPALRAVNAFVVRRIDEVAVVFQTEEERVEGRQETNDRAVELRSLQFQQVVAKYPAGASANVDGGELRLEAAPDVPGVRGRHVRPKSEVAHGRRPVRPEIPAEKLQLCYFHGHVVPLRNPVFRPNECCLGTARRAKAGETPKTREEHHSVDGRMWSAPRMHHDFTRVRYPESAASTSAARRSRVRAHRDICAADST